MYRNRYMAKGLLYGLVAGLLIGFLFKWIEAAGIANVYTLLLNVDFIPWFSNSIQEWQEFSLHLLVSLLIGALYTTLLQYNYKPMLWGMSLGFIGVPLFVPLTLLSERTPALHDYNAFLWWTIGHLAYGACLVSLGRIGSKPRGSRHFP